MPLPIKVLLYLYIILGSLSLGKLAQYSIEGGILNNEYIYDKGTYDQRFKQKWREGMIKCLDRKKKVIELECVIAHVYEKGN